MSIMEQILSNVFLPYKISPIELTPKEKINFIIQFEEILNDFLSTQSNVPNSVNFINNSKSYDRLREIKNWKNNTACVIALEAHSVILIFRKDADEVIWLEMYNVLLNSETSWDPKCVEIRPFSSQLISLDSEEAIVGLIDHLQNFEAGIHEKPYQIRKARVNVDEVREPSLPSPAFEFFGGLFNKSEYNNPNLKQVFYLKKIRDHAIKNGNYIWRRSIHWWGIKFALFSCCMVWCKENEGKLVYKRLLLLFMTYLLKRFGNRCGLELTSFMMKKIANRCWKLSKEFGEDALSPSEQEYILKQIKNKVKPAFIDPPKPIHVPKYEEFLSGITQTRPSINIPSIQKRLPYVLSDFDPRNQTLDDFILNLQILDKQKINFERFMFILHGVEVFIANNLTITNPDQFCYKKLFKLQVLLNELFETKSKDPYLESRNVLLSISLMIMIDQIASSKLSWLSSHNLFELEFNLEKLFLFSNAQEKLLKQVKSYLDTRYSNSNPSLPCVLKTTNSSFSSDDPIVKVAKDDTTCQSNLKQAKLDAEDEKKRKEMEFENESKRAKELRQKWYKMSCGYVTEEYYNKDSRTYEKRTHHASNCSKCALNNEINSISVKVFEWPFPDDPHHENAIMFAKYMSHTELEYLRNSIGQVTLLLDLVCIANGIKDEWAVNYEGGIGSTSKSFLETHYRSKCIEGANLKDISVPCGKNCVWTISNGKKFELSEKEKKFYLDIPDEKYRVLASFSSKLNFNGENEVICLQDKCPHELEINEFIEFGTLRSECYLQWPSLLRVIRDRSLSFQTIAVRNLILSAISQCGPEGTHQIVISNKVFRSGLLSSLSEFLDEIKENWSKFNEFGLIVLILVRISELLVVGQAEETKGLFEECQKIAKQWIVELTNQRQFLVEQHKITENSSHISTIALYGALSCYNISTSCSNWLFFICEHREQTPSATDGRNTQDFLLFHLWSFANRIQNELMNTLVLNNTLLTQFLRERWPPSNNISFAWRCYRENSWFETEIENTAIHIQPRSGRLLISGVPIGRLPDCIKTSSMYENLFGSSLILDVLNGVKPNSFTTKNILNQTFFFQFNQDNTELLQISRRFQNSNALEYLIPKSDLSQKLPHDLYKKHSHWVPENSNYVRFWPENVMCEDFFQSEDSRDPYIWDFSTGELRNTKSNELLIHVTTDVFQQAFFRTLSRLDSDPLFVQIWINQANKQVLATFSRMNLSFKLVFNNKYQWESMDWEHFRIADNQHFGALHSLGSGLLLEDYKAYSDPLLKENDRLVLPYGEVNFSKESVTIDHSSGYVPPYFEMRVDAKRFYEVSSNQDRASSLYLALLCAATSRPLYFEPLTREEGVASALRILYSPRVFSNEPRSQVEIDILKQISENLAPRRNKYFSTEEINWNDDSVYSFFEFEKLAIRAKELYETSISANYLHPNTKTCKFPNLELGIKALERIFSVQENKIYDEQNEKLIQKPTSQVFFPLFDPNVITFIQDIKPFIMDQKFTLNLEKLDQQCSFLDCIKIMDSCGVYEIPKSKYTAQPLPICWRSLLDAIPKRLFSKEITLSLLASTICSTAEKREVAQSFIIKLVRLYHLGNAPGLPNLELDWIPNQDANTPYSLDPPRRVEYRYDSDYEDELKQYKNAQIRWENRRNVWNTLVKINQLLLSNPIKANIETVKPLDVSHIESPKSTHTKQSSVFSFNRLKSLIFGMRRRRRSNNNNNIDKNYPKTLTEAFENKNKSWKEIFDLDGVPYYVECLNLLGIGIHYHPRDVLKDFVLKKSKYLDDVDIWKAIDAWEKFDIMTRLNRYGENPNLKEILKREEENKQNRKRLSREWHVLELELFCRIRPIQIQIAEHLLKPHNENTMYQLNMGEGKSTVILPMIASYVLLNPDFALKENEVLRFIVLHSLLNVTKAYLSFILGGCLAIPVYLFPFNRDIQYKKCASSLLSSFQNCIKSKGLVLSEPEHVLSLQCKELEIEIESPSSSRILKNLVFRNVLDECDEILHPRYQLVYTMGAQIQLESCRWNVLHACLSVIRNRANELYEKFGDACIELVYKKGNEQVLGIRLLDGNTNECWETLCNWIVDDIFDGKVVTAQDFRVPKNKHMKVFAKEVIMQNSFYVSENLKNLFESDEILETILSLRGLLTYEVLRHCLGQIWLVNYGNRLNNSSRMAVPYRSKNVPAERAEFAHPDSLIAFTALHYLYSGLTKEAFRNTLSKILENASLQNKFEHCKSFELSCENINIKDDSQIEKLYTQSFDDPFLIEIWLTSFIYPVDCKRFAFKISANPWDLSSPNSKVKCVGFSGSIDSKELFPFGTKQETPDPETSNRVETTLLNDNGALNKVLKLPLKFNEWNVIDFLIRENCSVLIDCSALANKSGMTNLEFAQNWLKSAPIDKYSACFYVKEDGTWMIVTRNNLVQVYSQSCYFNSLSNCLVFLDQARTRGVDLKLYGHELALVTIAPKLTKDKLFQACMRLRQLGKGQRVIYCCSPEIVGNLDTRKDVINYTKNQTLNDIKNGLTHWSHQGIRYCQRFTAESPLDCREEEMGDLLSMYSYKREVIEVIEISRHFAGCVLNKNGIENWKQWILPKLEEKMKGEKSMSSMVDEEQERELEQELEEERVVERPPSKTPYPPFISRFVRKVNDMEHPDLSTNNQVLSLNTILESSSHKKTNNNNMFFVTLSFYQTAQLTEEEEIDPYIRSVRWGLLSDDAICLLSGYEANYLITQLNNNHSKWKLVSFSPRISQNPRMSTSYNLFHLNLFGDSKSLLIEKLKDNLLFTSLFGGALYFGDEKPTIDLLSVSLMNFFIELRWKYSTSRRNLGSDVSKWIEQNRE